MKKNKYNKFNSHHSSVGNTIQSLTHEVVGSTPREGRKRKGGGERPPEFLYIYKWRSKTLGLNNYNPRT